MHVHFLKGRSVVLLIVVLVISSFMTTNSSLAAPHQQKSVSPNQIEPKAGAWKTWVLKSGDQFRLMPPPDKAASEAEIKQMKAMVGSIDATALRNIAYWDIGGPSYRWNQIAVDQLIKSAAIGNMAFRDLA